MSIIHQQQLIVPIVGGGDVVNLLDTQCSDEGVGGASCTIQCYDSLHGTRFGQVWVDDGGWIYDGWGPVTPFANIGDYQMKWDALSGDAPNMGAAENTWINLGVEDFDIGWDIGGEGDRTGAATVSIRKGTGSVLDTAVWDGEAVGTKRGQ